MIEVSQVLECKQLHGQGASIREISQKVGISRNTVRRYLRGDGTPGKYQMARPRPQPARGPIASRVRELLVTERQNKTPRKQRLTAARIHRILERGGTVISESTVRRLVHDIRLELRDPLEHAYLPLEYEPGEDAQVDFYEAVVDDHRLGRVKLYLLLVRACFSGACFAYAAPNQTREALFEGLMQAFEHFGGVFKKMWFDNLTPAVRKVLKGRTRELQQAFTAFQVHYGFDAEFCGPAKGTEKGAGAVFGDGLRCVGIGVVRLQIAFADASGRSASTTNIAAAGGVSPGNTHTYQLWYRDIFTSPCGPGFNLTNGLEIVWAP